MKITTIAFSIFLFFDIGIGQCAEISLPKPMKSSVTGRLWNNAGNPYPISNGYVFALSTDKAEVFGYSRTQPGRGPDNGRFNINNLPENGKILLVGFHPELRSVMAFKQVSLNGKRQDILTLAATIILPSDPSDPNIKARASLFDLLAYAGWIATRKMAADQTQQAMELSEKLLVYVEEKEKTSESGAFSNSKILVNLPFEGSAADCSGNGYHGSTHGGVSFTKGAIGLSASFNGKKSYIKLPTNSIKSDKFSVSIWVKTTWKYVQGMDLIVYNNTSAYYGWGLDLHKGNVRFRMVSNRGGDISSIVVPNTIGDNEWHHIVGVNNGEELSLYIDKEKVGVRRTPPMMWDTKMVLYLGADRPESSRAGWWYDGNIDEVKLYSGVLSKQDVINLFNRRFVGKPLSTKKENDASIEARLKKLNELYKKGLIDHDSFKSKQKEILEDI